MMCCFMGFWAFNRPPSDPRVCDRKDFRLRRAIDGGTIAKNWVRASLR